MDECWGYNEQYRDYTSWCSITYLKVAKGVNLKSFHHKKKKEGFVTLNGDG